MATTDRKRLCVVTTGFGPAIYDCVRILATRYEIHVVYLTYPQNKEYVTSISKLCYLHPIKYPSKTVFLAELSSLEALTLLPSFTEMFMKIRRVVKEHSIDLIHAYWSIPCGFLASLAAGKTPLITSLMGLDAKVQRKQMMFQPLVKYALKKSTIIITRSNQLKKEAIELGAQENKIHVVPRGVDLSKFTPRDKHVARAKLHLPNKFVILFVGNLIKLKGADRLIQVSARLSRDFDFYLLIVGDGPERANFERLAEELGLKNIVFTGMVPHDDVPFYMAASDVLVLASESEGLPGCVQEAMACGIPIVASNVGGLPDIITNGATGYLSSGEEEMEEQLKRLMSSPELCSLMGTNALNFARQTLSLDKVVEQLEKLYASLLA
jgi:teichuronic acid biosynthesis glycosyltransferase TuaC